MSTLTEIVKILFIIIVGIIGIYILARLAAYAAAKSWFQVKSNHITNNDKEASNEEKEN